jgi:hypothetical protein
VSLGRRLGRLARGFVSNINDERLRETIRVGREHGETLKDAFEAAWRGAAEEWRTAEERPSKERDSGERDSEERTSGRAYEWRPSSTRYAPVEYPPNVITAHHRLNLEPGTGLEEVHRKRRELVKRYHPDRFADPNQRRRAERLTAEINAAHDVIERYVLRS